MAENEMINNMQFEINALKSLLNDSDYQIIKLAEGFVDVTSITDLIKLIKDFGVELGELVKSRRKWRTRINELEVKISKYERMIHNED